MLLLGAQLSLRLHWALVTACCCDEERSAADLCAGENSSPHHTTHTCITVAGLRIADCLLLWQGAFYC
jgi:hypothetical protein